MNGAAAPGSRAARPAAVVGVAVALLAALAWPALHPALPLLPTDDLFAVDGPARLTIITCGGVYERDNGGYQANVIITAVPVPS